MALIKTERVAEILSSYAMAPAVDCDDCTADNICEKHHEDVWNRIKFADAVNAQISREIEAEFVHPEDMVAEEEDPVWAYCSKTGEVAWPGLYGDVVRADNALEDYEYWVTRRTVESPPPIPEEIK